MCARQASFSKLFLCLCRARYGSAYTSAARWRVCGRERTRLRESWEACSAAPARSNFSWLAHAAHARRTRPLPPPSLPEPQRDALRLPFDHSLQGGRRRACAAPTAQRQDLWPALPLRCASRSRAAPRQGWRAVRTPLCPVPSSSELGPGQFERHREVPPGTHTRQLRLDGTHSAIPLRRCKPGASRPSHTGVTSSSVVGASGGLSANAYRPLPPSPVSSMITSKARPSRSVSQVRTVRRGGCGGRCSEHSAAVAHATRCGAELVGRASGAGLA